jgi:hypothetical protein
MHGNPRGRRGDDCFGENPPDTDPEVTGNGNPAEADFFMRILHESEIVFDRPKSHFFRRVRISSREFMYVLTVPIRWNGTSVVVRDRQPEGLSNTVKEVDINDIFIINPEYSPASIKYTYHQFRTAVA